MHPFPALHTQLHTSGQSIPSEVDSRLCIWLSFVIYFYACASIYREQVVIIILELLGCRLWQFVTRISYFFCDASSSLYAAVCDAEQCFSCRLLSFGLSTATWKLLALKYKVQWSGSTADADGTSLHRTPRLYFQSLCMCFISGGSTKYVPLPLLHRQVVQGLLSVWCFLTIMIMLDTHPRLMGS